MTAWVDDYLIALVERDKDEKAEQGLYNKCQWSKLYKPTFVNESTTLDTRLADRVATRHPAATEYQNHVEDRQPHTADKQKSADSRFQQPASRDNHTLQKMLQDLGEAQRSKSAMELRLQQLADQTKKLSIQAEIDAKRIADLTIEKAHIFSRMRDRDEELKGKAKLLEVSLESPATFCLIVYMTSRRTSMMRQFL